MGKSNWFTRLFGSRSSLDWLDLAEINHQLVNKDGWTPERASATEGEYREFLALIIRNPGETIVPWSEDLDEYWHKHVLNTKKYERDCQEFVGKFVHHNPTLKKGTVDHTTACVRTSDLRHLLKNQPPKTMRSSSGCSSGCSSGSNTSTGFWSICGSDTGNSGDGGGHDSGGHDGGGSSCSSSSCGSSCGGGGCGGGGD